MADEEHLILRPYAVERTKGSLTSTCVLCSSFSKHIMNKCSFEKRERGSFLISKVESDRGKHPTGTSGLHRELYSPRPHMDLRVTTHTHPHPPYTHTHVRTCALTHQGKRKRNYS